MKRLLTIAAWAIVFLLFRHSGFSQGCVGVRPMSCSSVGNINTLEMPESGSWQLSLSYRYYKSHRHYRGDVEQKEREEEDTEVINTTHSTDVGVNYSVSSRTSFSVNLPIIYYDRSSLYEHYGNTIESNPNHQRFHTGAQGIGDLRISGYYLLFDPHTDSLKGNILAGMGIKFPTGYANVKDDFHKISSTGADSISNKPVDQSIQLGDAGWGFNPELQAYLLLSKRFSLYLNAYYLFNPRNVNTTLTRGVPPKNKVDSLTGWHSVADQYAARIGANYNLIPSSGITLSLGARIEGIPSKDLIGKNEGFRRPGYIVSAEPGISMMSTRWNIFVSVPVALYRNRTKSYSDLERDKMDPSVDHHGDAAFADYLINASIAYRLGKKQ